MKLPIEEGRNHGSQLRVVIELESTGGFNLWRFSAAPALLGRLDFNRDPVCDMRAARDVERHLVSELICIDAGLLGCGDAELGTGASMPEAVRKAHDAGHHFGADLGFGDDFARAGADARFAAVFDAEAKRVNRRHEQSASALALGEDWDVMQPGVHVAHLPSADQNHAVRAGAFFEGGM